MKRILDSVKLDLMAVKNSLKLGVIFLVIPTIIGLFQKQPLLTLGIALLLTSMMCGIVFQVHEKNNLGKLYAVLPLRKSEMIAGRYLYALLLLCVNLGLGTLVSLIVSRITGTEIEWLSFWAVLAIGFAYCCLIVSVGFPVYFRLEYQKAYAIANIPMLAVAIVAIVLARTTGLLTNYTDVINFFNDHMALLPLLGATLGLALLCVSMAISNGVYKYKEL